MDIFRAFVRDERRPSAVGSAVRAARELAKEKP